MQYKYFLKLFRRTPHVHVDEHDSSRTSIRGQQARNIHPIQLDR